MNTYEPIDERDPLTLIIQQEELDITYDEKEHFLTFMKETLQFILDSPCERKEIIIYAVLYCLQDFTTMEVSARERAKMLGISYGTIPHYKKQYRKQFNL